MHSCSSLSRRCRAGFSEVALWRADFLEGQQAKLTTGREIASRRRLKTIQKVKKSKSQKVFTFRLFGTFRLFATFRLFDFSGLFNFSGLFDFSTFCFSGHFSTFRLFAFFWSFSVCARAQPLAITGKLESRPAGTSNIFFGSSGISPKKTATTRMSTPGAKSEANTIGELVPRVVSRPGGSLKASWKHP